MKATDVGIFDIGIEKGKYMNTDFHSHLLGINRSVYELFAWAQGDLAVRKRANKHASHVLYTLEHLPLARGITMTTDSQYW